MIFFQKFFSDIFDNGGERGKYAFQDADYSPSTPTIWNPYNLDISSLTPQDISSSGSNTAYMYDVYNPKYNPDEPQYYTDNNYAVSDWENEYSTGGTRGVTSVQADILPSSSSSGSSSSRSKKNSSHHSSNSKRAVTKLKPKSKPRPSNKRSQQSRELERDLTPPPAKQK